MPLLQINKLYSDGKILFESDLDEIKSSLETFFNETKIDYLNLQNNAINSTLLASSVVDDSTLELNGQNKITLKDEGITTAKLDNDFLGMPVGAIQMFFDYNGTVEIPANWQLCNGSIISDNDSPLNGKYTPNFSSKYAQGVSATTATGNTAIPSTGNASVSLSHNHAAYFQNGTSAADTFDSDGNSTTVVNASASGGYHFPTSGIGSARYLINDLYTQTSSSTLSLTPLNITVLYIIRIK